MGLAVVSLLAVALLAPFLGKAIHLDDTLFVVGGYNMQGAYLPTVLKWDTSTGKQSRRGVWAAVARGHGEESPSSAASAPEESEDEEESKDDEDSDSGHGFEPGHEEPQAASLMDGAKRNGAKPG